MRLTLPSTFQLSLVILTATLLSACGFHLRGDYDIPEELSTMSLTSYDQYSSFTRFVKGQLRLNEIKLVEPAENVPNLHLVSESISERTLSLYQNARAAEKELTFRASYRVTIPELGDKTFSTSVTRSYLDNPLTALAKSVERDMIEDEMRKLAASQIIRQMARLKASIQEGTMDSADALQPNNMKSGYKIDTIEERVAPSTNSIETQ